MTSRTRTKLAACPVALACVLALASCSTDGSSDGDADGSSESDAGAGASGGDPGSAEPGDPAAGLSQAQQDHLVEDVDTTWDVSLSEDTTLVSGDALDALVSEDGNGTFVFDAEEAESAGIEFDDGGVLLIAGTALRRITDVSTSGSEVRVATEPASLADAIEDGTVAWDVPLQFDFDQFVTEVDASSGGAGAEESSFTRDPNRPRVTGIAMAMPDGRRLPVVTTADDDGGDDGSSVGGSVGGVDIEVKPDAGAVEWTVSSGGTKYQFRITAQGDSAEFLVVASRSGGGETTMAYRGEGTLGALRSSSRSEFSGGEVTGSQVGLDNLDAHLKLSASVAGAAVSPVNLEVPVPMLTFVWMVGPVPVTVEVSANIIGNVTATAQASATAEASFSYSGDAGFSFDGADVSASGNTEVAKMDGKPADSAAPMGVDVDAQFGVAFPEVTLSIFEQGLVPSIHFGAVIGSNLHWGEPKAGFAASSICKSAYVRAEVIGEYDLKVLGQTLGHDELTLWEDRKDAKNEGCENQEE